MENYRKSRLLLDAGWPSVAIYRIKQSCAAIPTWPTTDCHHCGDSILLHQTQLLEGFPDWWGQKTLTKLIRSIYSPLGSVHSPNLRILFCTAPGATNYFLSLFSSPIWKSYVYLRWKKFLDKVSLLKIDVSSLVGRMCREKDPGPSPEALSPGTFHQSKVRPQSHQNRPRRNEWPVRSWFKCDTHWSGHWLDNMDFTGRLAT